MTEKPSFEEILTVLGDPHAIRMFLTAKTGLATGKSAGKLGLTKKQFYTRLSRLINADLIAKRSGAYYQTYFGALVNDAVEPLADAVSKFWKLVAIDELKRSKVPPEELEKMIPSLVGSYFWVDPVCPKCRGRMTPKVRKDQFIRFRMDCDHCSITVGSNYPVWGLPEKEDA